MGKKILIIRDNDKSLGNVCYISTYISKKLSNMGIYSEITSIDKLIVGKSKNKNISNKINNYTNIIIIPRVTKSDDDLTIIEFIKTLKVEKRNDENKKYLSTIITYNNKKEESIDELLTIYKKSVEEIGFKWQKGIGINMGNDWINKELTKESKIYDPIIMELDFLLMDLKNNRSHHDFMFVKAEIVRGIVGKYYRFKDYLRTIKDRITKNTDTTTLNQ